MVSNGNMVPAFRSQGRDQRGSAGSKRRPSGSFCLVATMPIPERYRPVAQWLEQHVPVRGASIVSISWINKCRTEQMRAIWDNVSNVTLNQPNQLISSCHSGEVLRISSSSGPACIIQRRQTVALLNPRLLCSVQPQVCRAFDLAPDDPPIQVETSGAIPPAQHGSIPVTTL